MVVTSSRIIDDYDKKPFSFAITLDVLVLDVRFAIKHWTHKKSPIEAQRW